MLEVVGGIVGDGCAWRDRPPTHTAGRSRTEPGLLAVEMTSFVYFDMSGDHSALQQAFKAARAMAVFAS